MYPSPLDLARNITKFVSKLTKNGRTTSLDIKLLDIVQVCESDSNANKSFLDDVPPANNNFFHSGNTPITPVRASSQIADDEFHNSPPTPTPTAHTSAAHQSPENSKDSNGNITMSANKPIHPQSLNMKLRWVGKLTLFQEPLVLLANK